MAPRTPMPKKPATRVKKNVATRAPRPGEPVNPALKSALDILMKPKPETAASIREGLKAGAGPGHAADYMILSRVISSDNPGANHHRHDVQGLQRLHATPEGSLVGYKPGSSLALPDVLFAAGEWFGAIKV